MSKHALDQVIDASNDVVKAALPSLGGRVYRVGDPDWDRRSYPVVVGDILKSSVEIIGENGDGAARLQYRQALVVFEIHHEEISDVNAEMSQYRIALEASLVPAKFPLPIDDIQIVDDSGIEAVKKTETSVLCALALRFVIGFHTLEGEPTRIVDPENPFNASGDFFDE